MTGPIGAILMRCDDLCIHLFESILVSYSSEKKDWNYERTSKVLIDFFASISAE